MILDAALLVFAEKGYHDARISDIARRAETAYGLVYHYFKNKEEILDTIFEERWTGFIAAIRAIREDDRSAEEKLVAIAELILRDHRARPEWIKVLIFEIQRTRRFAEPDRMRRTEELFEHVAGLLRAAQRRGELRGDLQPELAARIFIGGLDILVTSRALALIEVEGNEDANAAEMARTMVELFMRGMSAQSD
jgi:TetR/AcrR family fatty acid metabolism transcriptional regulator